MIGETFQVNGKTYTIKKSYTFGHNRRLSKIRTNLQLVQDEFFPNKSGATTEDILALDVNRQAEYIKKQSKIIEDNDQLLVDTLSEILGLSQDEIDNLGYPLEATQVFEAMLSIVATPKKK